VFCILLILANFASTDSSTQFRETPYGEMGFYGDFACFQGDSSRYYGAEAGVSFSPFRYTDVGIGFSLMSGNDQTFTFVNGRLGLFSPAVWKLRALCGMSVGIQVTAPDMYMFDCDWPGRDDATGGWILPFCGLGFQLEEGDSGFSLSIDSRIFFTDHEIRRISSGIVLSKSISSE
jgi:hypothetical protein